MATFTNPKSRQVLIGHLHGGDWVLCWISGFLILAMLLHSRGVLAQESPSQYRSKAALVLNFSKFIQWPEDSFSDSNAPLVIGMVGADLFGNQLPQAIAGKTVQGRSLVIRRYKAGEDMRNCQILFIGASERARLSQILASLRGSSVLTVGEMDHFVEAGGIIRISYQGGYVRFAVGLDAASQARLKVSSKLLRVAEYVETNGATASN